MKKEQNTHSVEDKIRVAVLKSQHERRGSGKESPKEIAQRVSDSTSRKLERIFLETVLDN